MLTILMLGLRDYTVVGVDLLKYYRTYLLSQQVSLAEIAQLRNGSNALYYLLCAFFSKNGFSYQLFIFCVSAFCGIVNWRYIYLYCERVEIGFLFYIGMGVYTFQFSGLKQSIAMAFVLLSFECLFRKRIINFLVLLSVACLFHPTAIIFLPVALVSLFKLSKWVIAAYAVMCAFVFSFRMQIAHFITSVYDSEYIGKYESSHGIGGLAVFLLLFTVLYIFGNSKRIRVRGSKEFYMACILMVSVIVQFFSSYAYSFTRLNLYYVQFLGGAAYGMIYNMRLNNLFKKAYPLIRFCLIVALYVIMITQYYHHIEVESLTEYRFFWEIL